MKQQGMLHALVVAAALSGCGGAQTPSASNTDRLAPARLYPLAEGTVWTYDVDTGEGVPTLAITRVLSTEGDTVEVSSGSAPVVYEVRPEGLYRPDRGGWVLKAPVRVGATWPAGGGATAEVVEDDMIVSTMAGDFRGCVAVEERGADSGKQVRTVYCPDVGPVKVQSSMQMDISGQTAEVKATLRGYALRGM